jgi:hypothetical protein
MASTILILSALALLWPTTMAESLKCPGLNMGTEMHRFDIVMDGNISPAWHPETNKTRRNVVQRQSEYFYVKYSGKEQMSVCIS